jgi:hypothetical protein
LAIAATSGKLTIGMSTDEALRRLFVRLTEIRDLLKEIRDQSWNESEPRAQAAAPPANGAPASGE